MIIKIEIKHKKKEYQNWMKKYTIIGNKIDFNFEPPKNPKMREALIDDTNSFNYDSLCFSL